MSLFLPVRPGQRPSKDSQGADRSTRLLAVPFLAHLWLANWLVMAGRGPGRVRGLGTNFDTMVKVLATRSCCARTWRCCGTTFGTLVQIIAAYDGYQGANQGTSILFGFLFFLLFVLLASLKFLCLNT